jgi:hypothetical protein
VGGIVAPGSTVYFKRPDVIKAIHAPASLNWTDCSVNPVFVGSGGDQSADSIQKVLPQVIEHTNRVLVSNAEWGAYSVPRWHRFSVTHFLLIHFANMARLCHHHKW